MVIKTQPVAVLSVIAATLAALVLGIVGGQALTQTALAEEGGGPDRESVLADLPPVATNERGQTYGSMLHATSAADAPDLVLVIGNNGREGYVLSSELEEPVPDSPESARSVSEVRTLDVVLSDGVTVIDTFTVGGAKPQP